MIQPEDIRMYQLAQEITDEILGPGTYVGLNHFDPSKGETCRADALRNDTRTMYLGKL